MNETVVKTWLVAYKDLVEELKIHQKESGIVMRADFTTSLIKAWQYERLAGLAIE